MYTVCTVYCAVCTWYTILYACNDMSGTPDILLFIFAYIYIYIYIFVICLVVQTYQKSYTVQYSYKYTYCTYSVQCSSENKLYGNYILFIYLLFILFIYFIHLLDCFVLLFLLDFLFAFSF